MRTNIVILALAVGLAVSACDKKDEVLAGKREDIRAVFADAASDADPVLPENRVQGISLPPAQLNANWLQSPSSEFARTSNPALSANSKLIWSVDIGRGDTGRQRITADPVVAGNAVYTLDSQALVTATSTSGKKLWSVNLTPPHESAADATGGGLAFADNMLFVTSGFGLLTALNAQDGKVIWQQKLGNTSSGAPSVYDGIVYLVSGDEIGWAIDASDGRVLWQTEASPDINNILGTPAPAISAKFVVFSYGVGEVQGVFRSGGLRMWEAQISGQRPGNASALIQSITGAPTIVGDNIYLGTHAGRVVALDLGNGERLWTANEASLTRIWPAGGSLFFVSDKNELMRLDAATGERIWGVRLPLFTKTNPKRQARIYAHHGPMIAGGQLVVASGDGHLSFFDPVSGGLRNSVDIPGGATTDPVVAGGTLYVVTTKGQLLAYR